jgi:hypothetical protein
VAYALTELRLANVTKVLPQDYKAADHFSTDALFKRKAWVALKIAPLLARDRGDG